MFGEMTCEANQPVFGDLSPPYDGSEMDLFPDLSFLNSVQSDFLSNKADDIVDQSLMGRNSEEENVVVEPSNEGDGQANTAQVLEGIVNPDNPTLWTSSPKGKSVIKVIVNSSKDETELVKFLMAKVGNGSGPRLRVIKKSTGAAVQDSNNNEVSTTSYHENKDCIIKGGSSRPTLSRKKVSTKSKELSLIEKLEHELQVCDPINKNAIAARLNRLRKKNHVEDLEESVKNLKSENFELADENKILSTKVSALETEVNYLKGILANQSSLSSLLSNIQATNLNFHTSMDVQKISDNNSVFPLKSDDDEEIDVVGMSRPKEQKRKRKSVLDNSQQMDSKIKQSKLEKSDQAVAGVCLHVSGKNVSLEFCSHCSRKAQSTIQMSSDNKKAQCEVQMPKSN